MSNPTSNFGWQMPTATDLVTDLPADFEVFGQAVDTDFVDLLGGTTGQILSKTSATDLDFTWIANDQGDITGVTAGNGITVTSPTGPVPTVAIDTAVTVDKTTAQTLTNKTLTTPIIATISNTGTLTLPTSTDTLVGRATTDTLTNKKLSDSTTTIVDVSDTTKAIKFDVAGTTGITGTIATAFTTGKTVTIPDTTGTIALTNGVINNTLTTTTGDIIYASAANTPARLGIGSSAQVLAVSGGIPAWTTASSGSFIKVAGTTFSAVTSFSAPASTFTSTYKIYKIFVVITTAGNAGTLTLKGRVSGTDSNGSWYGTNFGYKNNSTTVNDTDSGATAKTLTYTLGQSYLMNTIDLTWANPQPATRSQVCGTGFTFDDAGAGAATSRVFGGWDINSTQYDSFSVICSVGSITGYYSVYGLEV